MEQEATIRERLRQWRREHPQATFDEIDAEVGRQYAALQAAVVVELSLAGTAERDTAPPRCPSCTQPLQRRGTRRRMVTTRRGMLAEVERSYYVCPVCGTGLFPPG